MTRESGIGWIELMVVLAMISLLSCFVYPVYSSYWMQVKRLVLLAKGYIGETLQGLGVNEQTERGWYHEY